MTAVSTPTTAYQTVFQNPMAAPDILGASSGACFGAALGILTGQSIVLILVMQATNNPTMKRFFASAKEKLALRHIPGQLVVRLIAVAQALQDLQRGLGGWARPR